MTLLNDLFPRAYVIELREENRRLRQQRDEARHFLEAARLELAQLQASVFRLVGGPCSTRD